MKDYNRDNIKPNDREKYYVDSYDPGEIEAIRKTQQQVIDYQKKKNIKTYSRLTVIDDFADDTYFTRKSQLLHQLCIRGRHYMISTIISTQVYKQILLQ